MGKSVIIIGSGIAGLAASIRLVRKGYAVTVFEANHYPGGKLREVKLGGYRFDTSATLLTLPEEIEDLYKLCRIDIQDHFQYEKLASAGKHFYADGTFLEAYHNADKLLKEVGEKTQEPEKNIKRALERSAKRFDEYTSKFLKNALPESAIIRKANAWKYGIQQSGLKRTVSQTNRSRLEKQKAIQFFNQYAASNGSDPYRTPAAFNIHPHIQLGLGIYLPNQGMQSLPTALYSLAKAVGVKFQFGTRVEKIVVHEGEVKGVNTQMGFHKSDRVVSNMDVQATYSRLLKNSHRPSGLKRSDSSSILTFFWGIKGVFNDLAIQNTFYSENSEAEFEQIYRSKTIYQDPTISLKITSIHRSDDAPQGCQNWAVTVKAPNNSGQNWDQVIKDTRTNLIRKLSRMLDSNIEEFIEVEEILHPRLIEEATSSWQGALYGAGSHHKYAPFLRHPNRSGKIGHLYFCGSSVHPGGGIPMCLQSAKIMADQFK